MEKIIYCVGIDVDKQTFKVCLLANNQKSRKIQGSRTFDNTVKGVREFLRWVDKRIKGERPEVYFTLEATGVYHELLAHMLHKEGKAVNVVLPLKAKRYIQSLGIRSKTDKIDARGLAYMGSEQSLDLWEPISPEFLNLRGLTRQIEALKKSKTAYQNQLEGANYSVGMPKEVIKALKSMIKHSDKQIDKLEAIVKKTIKEDEALNEKYELLTSLKGVGILTFAVVAAETNGFALFKNQRQLVCYSGYDIVENQSGKRVGKTSISKKGNAHIRRILHMAALSVKRSNIKPFANLQERVYKRSGYKMKGYVAVQRKLLVMMYTLWKKNEKYDQEYHIKQSSGIYEPKTLFSVFNGGHEKTATTKAAAALDGLPCNQSPVALFSVKQN